MNNSDHISPYRQSTSPSYQNAHVLSDPEIMQKLPVDVLEMIEKGDLDGAMSKLKEHAQENETLMNLLFQLMGEMTASFFKPFSMITARFSSLFGRTFESEKAPDPSRKNRVRNAQDPEKLKTEKDFELYMRAEVTKINMDPKLTEKRKPFPLAGLIKIQQKLQIKLLAAMATAGKNFKYLLAYLPVKHLAMFQAKMLAQLTSYSKMVETAIKNLGGALDQKIFVPLAKGIAAPLIFLGKHLEPIIKPLVERFSYANKTNKKMAKRTDKIPKYLEPLAAKLKATKNRLFEIKKTVFETIGEIKSKVVEKAKDLAFTFMPKPLIRLIETRFRHLPEYANSLKEVVQQNIQVIGHVIQQFNQLAVTTFQPMINFFVYAQRTTMKYSLAGIKWIHKKMQDSFSKAKKRIYEKLEALANKTIKSVTTAWKASYSMLKRLAIYFLSLLQFGYQASKALFFKSLYFIWPIIKNASFIFWLILSTIPKAGWFLVHRELNKIKKALLIRLRNKGAIGKNPR